ncbi:OmpA family protein [Salipiger marinus]|uniref:Outer membrane protein OmpA n=1 Tax=Salipiger marinus TaxID=555512 RepID=A0A1G8NYS5_9RHOB|nr:OmpA family protein [Salipiger marinus]SDI85393.1 Outer membrane protein OmpA [Salipiger marinus]
MTLRFLKSTTALALAASLTLPVAAQQAEQAAPELSACAEAQDPEACRAAAEGAAAPEGLPAGEAVEGEAATPADALPDAAAQDAPDSESEAVEDLREMKDDAATRDEVQATPETPEQEAPAAEADAKAEAEVEVAPGQQATPDAQAPAEEAAPEVTAEQPAPEAEPDAAPTEAPAPEIAVPEAEDASEAAETEAEGTAEDTASPEAEQETAEQPAPEAEQETAEQPETEDTPEQQAAPVEAPATQNTEAEEEETAEQPASPETPETEETEETAGQPAPDAQDEAEQAEAEAESDEDKDARQAESAQQTATGALAAAAAALGLGEAEMVEESLTEADVRSSAEDFATRLQANPQARSEDDDDDDDDEDGLSNFEAAAILGLGTLALSQILNDDERVVQNTGDRVVVEQNGQYRVLRNDDVLLRQPGSDVQTYRYDDGSTRSVVTYDDGTVVETIKAADGRVLRRSRVLPDGQEVLLFDDTAEQREVVISDLPQQTEEPARINFRDVQEQDLAAALATRQGQDAGRSFSLNQIRNIDRVRHLVPEISVDTVQFATNSAAIRPEEAQALVSLGNAMREIILQNPGEVFLIEGHTDATGGEAYNLALSDRRAESVALALSEYFDVPPENMVLQGYGESDLAVETQADERANRRAAVRRITPLLQPRS